MDKLGKLEDYLSRPYKVGNKTSTPAMLAGIAVILGVVVSFFRATGVKLSAKILSAIILLAYGVLQVYAIRCLDFGNCSVLSWLVAIVVILSFATLAIGSSMIKDAIDYAEKKIKKYD